MRLATALPALVLGLTPLPAAACNICHTPTSLGVRHLLLDHDFLLNAAAVLAPLPLLLLCIAAVAGTPLRRP